MTLLSASGPKPTVVAARSTPLSSDKANWLSSVPGTAPLAEYPVRSGSEVSKRWIDVFPPSAPSSQRWVAT